MLHNIVGEIRILHDKNYIERISDQNRTMASAILLKIAVGSEIDLD